MAATVVALDRQKKLQTLLYFDCGSNIDSVCLAVPCLVIPSIWPQA